MRIRSGIFGFLFASSIAIVAGFANADESNQKDEGAQPANRWTGFYVGANSGLGRSSDSKDVLAFGAQESSIGGSKSAGSSAFSSDLTGYDLQHGPLGMGPEGEISKALRFDKSK